MTETKPDGTTEVLACPYCGLEVTNHLTPLVWRGKQQVRYQTVSHRLPVCFGFKHRKKKQPDAFLEAARQAVKARRGP